VLAFVITTTTRATVDTKSTVIDPLPNLFSLTTLYPAEPDLRITTTLASGPAPHAGPANATLQLRVAADRRGLHSDALSFPGGGDEADPLAPTCVGRDRSRDRGRM
jgi:hypothetical protein